ncbi:MAG: hypothetical protein M3494_15100 [Actinomycetota bacterium]|nr:hypothetical protein [Actinomycetota bacterium]
MEEIKYSEFLPAVEAVSALGADNDFVIAAIQREQAAHRGVLYRERIQEVANEARERAGNYIPATRSRNDGSGSQSGGPSPDAAFLSKAFAKRLEPWAKELREDGFGGSEAPFFEGLVAAADWIETQSEADRERWERKSALRLDAEREIEKLADLAGLVVHTVSRYVRYVRPGKDFRQMARVFPGTFLDRLARETERVSKKTAFQPEVLTGFVLTGLQPIISRVRITKSRGGCAIPGDSIPSQSVTLEFNAADVSYEEVRTLYAEIREFFEAANAERLSWHEFDFISLVDGMGGSPERGNKTRFWEEVRRRWNEDSAAKRSRTLSSWQAARNKFERLNSRKNVRELTTPNPPLTPTGLKHAIRTRNNERLQSRQRLLLCCIRAATGAVNSRTEQKSSAAASTEIPLHKPNSPTEQKTAGKPEANLQGGSRWFEPSIAHKALGVFRSFQSAFPKASRTSE